MPPPCHSLREAGLLSPHPGFICDPGDGATCAARASRKLGGKVFRAHLELHEVPAIFSRTDKAFPSSRPRGQRAGGAWDTRPRRVRCCSGRNSGIHPRTLPELPEAKRPLGAGNFGSQPGRLCGAGSGIEVRAGAWRLPSESRAQLSPPWHHLPAPDGSQNIPNRVGGGRAGGAVPHLPGMGPPARCPLWERGVPVPHSIPRRQNCPQNLSPKPVPCAGGCSPWTEGAWHGRAVNSPGCRWCRRHPFRCPQTCKRPKQGAAFLRSQLAGL